MAANGECLLWTGTRCSVRGRLVGNYGVIYVKCKQLPSGSLGWKSTSSSFCIHVTHEIGTSTRYAL